jgi:hypothetical protein
MFDRLKNSDPFATLHSLTSAFGFGQLTADKREIKDFPKSRQGGTSFICKTLYAVSKK